MSEVNEGRSWAAHHDLARTPVYVYDEAGIPYGIPVVAAPPPGNFIVGRSKAESWKFHAVEFAKGLAEMSVELGKGCRDVVKQTVIRDDSVLVRKLRGPCAKASAKLRFLNEYLPEDRDPVHSWTVIFIVCLLAFVALYVNTECKTDNPMMKKLYIHPPNATRVLLPDGRYLAYQEQGVSADRARFSIITAHSFLSSRMAGIPGIKVSLLQDFGVRLLTYDLPGFGESDPHPRRNLESSALDMLHLSYAVSITEKFWVMGYSGGSIHVWAALRYIPDRVAGAFMVAPMVNPYEPRLKKEEKHKIWKAWTPRKKFMYFLARRFPSFLPYFYRRSFLSGNLGQIEKWHYLSLAKRDTALVEGNKFQDFWRRDVEESVRQRNVKPFVEEAVLQVSNWGFSPADLKVKKKSRGKGVILWLRSMYSKAEEELTGFLGPIYIWQGLDDRVVPPSMSDFVQRVLPGAMIHKLLYDGHYTYFYFCDECHEQMFSTVFGTAQGPLATDVDQMVEKEDEDIEDITHESSVTEEDTNLS